LGTWQSTPTAKPAPIPGAPNLVQQSATGKGAVPQADFINLSLDEGLAWVQEAWQRTQHEVASLAQSDALVEEGPASEGEGSWWEEVGATGDALHRITHEVSKRILPMEVPYLNETSQEQEKVLVEEGA
jgi:hypothetical protein